MQSNDKMYTEYLTIWFKENYHKIMIIIHFSDLAQWLQ